MEGDGEDYRNCHQAMELRLAYSLYMMRWTYFGSAFHRYHNQAHHTPDPLEIPKALGIVDYFGRSYTRRFLPRLGARELPVSFIVFDHHFVLTRLPLLVSLSTLIVVISVLALIDVLSWSSRLCARWLI